MGEFMHVMKANTYILLKNHKIIIKTTQTHSQEEKRKTLTYSSSSSSSSIQLMASS